MPQNVPTIVNRRLTNLAIVIDRSPLPYSAAAGLSRIVRLDLARVYRTATQRLRENTVDPGYGIVVTWAPSHGHADATHTEAAVCVQDEHLNAIVWRWILPIPGDWNSASIVGLLDPRCSIIYEDDIIDEAEEDYFRGLAILKEHYKAEMREHLRQTSLLYPAEAIPPQQNNRCILLDTR